MDKINYAKRKIIDLVWQNVDEGGKEYIKLSEPEIFEFLEENAELMKIQAYVAPKAEEASKLEW